MLVLGGLHIEKLIYEVLEDYFEGSGWSTAICNGGVASSGESQTYTGVHLITRSRYFHQVSALALHVLLEKAYLQYLEFDFIDDEPLSKNNWIVRQKTDEPQFMY